MNEVYNELKKRDLIIDNKEFNNLIWLKQIYVNDKLMETSKQKFDKIDKIKIGLSEFDIKNYNH